MCAGSGVTDTDCGYPTSKSPDAENESVEDVQSVQDTVTANADAEKSVVIRDPAASCNIRFMIFTFCLCE